MVKYRPNPLGKNEPELFRWQASMGPFRKINFSYAYYKFYDYALKSPWPAMLGVTMMTMLPFLAYKYISTYNSSSSDPMAHIVEEKLFEYTQWANDHRRIRGEWNNNFGCWSDNPDCGKDYEKVYFN